jgi:two-component system NtrC family response regulator
MTEARKPLLIVEDDPALQKQMQWAFDQYETILATDCESAIAQVRRYEPAVVTMDLGLPPNPDDPTQGLQLLREIHALAPDTKVIVLTGQNDRANAVRTIALGAYDFCTKPFEPEILVWTINRAFRVHELQAENRRLQSMQTAPGLSGTITRDPEVLRVCRLIEKVAPTAATVHPGESGTGKLLAQALHELSPRRSAFLSPSIARRSRNLRQTLRLREGAYTEPPADLGQDKTPTTARCFWMRSATCRCHRGKALRFLQERHRAGRGRQEIPVDVRIVCGRRPEGTMAGKFREDLYYRLGRQCTFRHCASGKPLAACARFHPKLLPVSRRR